MTQKLLFAALLVAALLAFSAAVSAYSNELSLEVSEEIDLSAETDGAYTWQYTATGGAFTMNVTNEQGTTATGDADTRLFDLMVPFDVPTGIFSGANCTLLTDDANLEANRCAVSVCIYVGAMNLGASCYCLDNDGGILGAGGTTPFDATRIAALYYNPYANGSVAVAAGYVREFVHINELQGSKYAAITCDLGVTGLGNIEDYPIVFSETFSPRKIVNNACTDVTVTLNVSNNFDDTPCEDLNVTVKKVLSLAGDGWENLSVINAGTGDSEGLQNITWNFVLAANDTESLTFIVQACPNMTGNTSKLEMGRAYVDYNSINASCLNRTFLNVSVGHVTAVGPGELNVTKEHYINSNPPNWAENSTFYDSTADLNYTIYRFRLWAENGTDPTTVDPNNPALAGSDYNCTIAVGGEGIAAGGTFECDGNTFNSNDIPVVFGKPVFELVEGGISGWDDYYVFENSKNASLPLGSDYFLIENMWVINGYLVKASKSVTPGSTPGCYNVTITVENLGETCTPYLYVYDIVPEEFYGAASAINNLTSPWNILVSKGEGDPDQLQIALPGNAQPLLQSGIYDLTYARLLAFAVPGAVLENWTYANVSGTFNDSQYTGKTENLVGTYAGTGYRWELFPMLGSGTGGGGECAAGQYSNLEISAYGTVYITYALCADTANMTYYPSELFIVGIDPINAEGVAAPLASVGFGSGEKSGEPLLMVFLAVLAVIAAALFVKKRRE